MEFNELPLGFGMALAQNELAMRRFESMSEEEKEALLRRVHKVGSKGEMQGLIAGIGEQREEY